MTITAQDFIINELAQVGLPAPAIHHIAGSADAYRIIPSTPYSADDMALISSVFGEVTPYDAGAEISIPDDYPPAPASPADRDWLTADGTMPRRVEAVLAEHGLIDNVQRLYAAPTANVAHVLVEFAGPVPTVPVNGKLTSLKAAGLIDIRLSPPGWKITCGNEMVIEHIAGQRLRQRENDIRDLRARAEDLEARLTAALSALDQTTDANAVLTGKLATIRADRDALEAQLTAPAMPKWTPRRDERGYTLPAGHRLEIAVSLEHLNELLGLGGRMIGQPEFLDKSDLRVLVEMRASKAAHLPGVVGRVTVIDADRPYTMRRADRIARDNAQVIQAIRGVQPSPRPVHVPLIGGQHG